MTKIARILPSALLAVALASAAGAQTGSVSVDQLVANLTAQGFTVTELRRTWLGRVRIEAMREGFEREIVIDPRNGVILRDILEIEIEDDDEDDDEDGDADFDDDRHDEDEDDEQDGDEDDEDDEDDEQDGDEDDQDDADDD